MKRKLKLSDRGWEGANALLLSDNFKLLLIYD